MKEFFESIHKSFDNREIAVIIWIIIGLIFVLSKTSFRKSLFDFLKILFNLKIISIIIFAWAYSLIIIYILYSFQYWDYSMTKDSIFWFLLSGLVILFNLNKAEQNKDYFLDIIKDNIKFTLLLEFIANIYNFSLLVELFFIPLMVLFSVIIPVALEANDLGFIDSLSCVLTELNVSFNVLYIILASFVLSA